MNKLLTFLHEVKGEVKKVTWPGRDEVVGAAVIVCILVIVFAFILGAMDTTFGFIIRKLIL